MGNPHETDFFYTGTRDWGAADPPPSDVVFESCRHAPPTPEQRAKLDPFFQEARKFLDDKPVFAQKPAYQERPFFAKSRTVIGEGTIPAATTHVVVTHTVPARHAAIITAIGVDLDCNGIAALNADNLRMWVEINGVVSPIFERQVSAVNAVDVTQNTGKVRRFPGSTNNPFCLLSNSLQERVLGTQQIDVKVQNGAANTVGVCILFGYYEYRLPFASEYEKADLQV